MKKKNVFFTIYFILLLGVMFLGRNVSAYDIERYYVNGSYSVPKSQDVDQMYRAMLNGEYYPAFCIDPGVKDGGDVTSSSNVLSTNPRKYTVGTNQYMMALAFQYLYQELSKSGYTSINNPETWSAGTTAFRIVTHALPEWNRSIPNDPSYWGYGAYHLYDHFGSNIVEYNNGVRLGKLLGQEAINFATQNYNKEFDELIDNGTVSNAKWEVSETSIVENGSTLEITFVVKPTDPSKVGNVQYDKFGVEFSNPSVKVIGKASVEALADKGAKITVKADANAWNGDDLGATINVYYCDYNSAASQVRLVDRDPYTQRFVIVRQNNKCNDGGDWVPVRPRYTSDCKCSDDKTKYIYTKYKNGKVIETKTWGINEKAPDGVDASSCPADCDGDDNNKHSCELPSEKNGNKYYCKESQEGLGDGQVCTEAEYKKQCSHSCEKPSADNGNKYYCKESKEGLGDGKSCSEADFYNECCDTLDPNSEEYKNKCLNCNATVSIPSKCLDFNTNDFLTGSISDINKLSSECNQYANQIKNCVLGKTDTSNKSYEATTELNNNPYCKVWCEEKYDFDLPTAQYTQSGGYFTLSTKISAVRNCYTSSAEDPSKPIDSEKFKNDLLEAQKAVIDAYNAFAPWNAAASIASTSEKLSCSYSGQEASQTCGENGSSSCNDGCSSGSKEATGYKKAWSWVEYDYSGNKTQKSDSYGPGTSQNGTCSCTINAESNRDEDHKKKMEETKNVLVQKINALNDIISKYNSCSGVVGNESTSSLATNTPASTAVSSWSNNMQFDPKITFSYSEDYIKNMKNEFEVINKQINEENAMYCLGDVDDQYNCLSGVITGNVPTYDQTYFTCDASGCGLKSSKVSSATWIRKTKNASGEYQPNNKFSTATQYGTIKFGQLEDGTKGYYLATNLPEHALPIQLRQKTGLFEFKFTFSNIGQSNQDGTLGRLMGNTTSVLTEYNKLPDSKKCGMKNASATTDGSYMCYYINNCDECKIKCEPDCELEPPCPDCLLTCKNCVFDGDGATYSYRSVSLNSMFPNDRTIGFNWDSLNNVKAHKTKNAIDEAGESIYEKPQYSVHLTRSNLVAIRKYNDDAGSYVNVRTPMNINGDDSAVYCKNITIAGNNYSVKCKSRFLDLLESDKRYAASMTRITSDNASIGGKGDDAWELFTDDAENIKYISRADGIGPSWRIRSGN